MKNVLVSWELPTTRQQGGPLAIADIAFVRAALSADDGANFTDVADVPSAQAQEVPINDLPFSDQFVVRLTVHDTDGRISTPVDAAFSVADDSAPGIVQNVTVTFP